MLSTNVRLKSNRSIEGIFSPIFILNNFENHTVKYASRDTVFTFKTRTRLHMFRHIAHLSLMLCKNNKLEPVSQFSGAVCYI